MSVKMEGTYVGNTRVRLTHESGAEITCCAPKDNGGDGSLFSPTDLTAAATGACMLTIMAKVAERDGIPFEGARFTVEKIMNPTPRRIGKLVLEIRVPGEVSEKQRRKLEIAAATCPVKRSLDPAVETEIRYVWG